MAAKITISLSPSLLKVLDRFAERFTTTRSGAVAELLRRAEREEMERQLEEGYAACTALNQADAEVFLPAQAEVILRDRS
jgi:CopG family transcriptional regulator/antitoxin EndoAI